MGTWEPNTHFRSKHYGFQRFGALWERASLRKTAPCSRYAASRRCFEALRSRRAPTYFEHAPRVFLICSERITNVLGGYINLDGARHEYTTLQKAIRDHVESEDKGVNEMVTP